MARSQGVPGLTPFQNENMNVETSLSLHFPRFNSQLGADLVNRVPLLKCLRQPLQ